MRGISSKVFVFLLGALAVFVLAEILLRTLGIVYSYYSKPSEIFEREPGSRVILCLGDSFTQGTGAPKGRGYPEQLEELLQKKYPNEKIKVINKGTASFNSAEILEIFDKSVDTLRPDIIVLLAGGANAWNVYGYSKRFPQGYWGDRLSDFFYGLKTFRLVRLLILDCQSKIERFKYNSLAYEFKKKMTEKAEKAKVKGWESLEAGRYEEAIYWFTEQTKVDPLSREGFFNLKEVYSRMSNPDGLRLINKELLKRNPYDRNILKHFGGLIQHGDSYKDDFEFIKQSMNVNSIADDILASKRHIKNYEYNLRPWVRRDVLEIIQKAEKRGIGIFLQTYPNYQEPAQKSYLRQMNILFKEIAQETGVPLIDHEAIFNQIFLLGRSRDDYFEPAKCHCNEKGYAVMAANIYCGMAIFHDLVPFFPMDAGEREKCLKTIGGSFPAPRGVK